MPYPIPLVPPVINATLFCNEFIDFSFIKFTKSNLNHRKQTVMKIIKF